jgi:hypothetical protein
MPVTPAPGIGDQVGGPVGYGARRPAKAFVERDVDGVAELGYVGACMTEEGRALPQPSDADVERGVPVPGRSRQFRELVP